MMDSMSVIEVAVPVSRLVDSLRQAGQSETAGPAHAPPSVRDKDLD
jgi:hypothetical protein